MARQALRTNIMPRGLKNRKNDCFFNSTIQCLLGIPQLNYFYLNTDFKPSQKISIAFSKFLREFIPGSGSDLVKNSDSADLNCQTGSSKDPGRFSNIGPAIDPYEFILALRPMSRLFDGNEQDSHEFLYFLLDTLYTELGDNGSSSLSDLRVFNSLVSTNIIARIFYGMLTVSLMCLSCKNVKSQYENFVSLILNVSPDLETSLADFMKSEKLVDRLKCEECNEMTEAARTFEFHTLPEVLIIQFKRFLGFKSKDMQKVDFQKSLKIKNLTYKLIGYICHSGTLRGGHYVAYGERNREWYYFDDSTVIRAGKDMNINDAYILFYSRI